MCRHRTPHTGTTRLAGTRLANFGRSHKLRARKTKMLDKLPLDVTTLLCCAVFVAVLLVFSFAGSGSHETDDKSAESSAEQKAKPVRERPTGPFTVAQVAEHKTRDDAWLIIDGKVYDVTDFVDDHPGGDSILDNAGADSSAGFHGDQHPETVAEAVEEFYIGELKKDQ